MGLPISSLLSTGGRNQPGPAIHLTSAETCIFLEITDSGTNVVGGYPETLKALGQILTNSSCLEKIWKHWGKVEIFLFFNYFGLHFFFRKYACPSIFEDRVWRI